jgi:hypothetical protein
VIPMAIWSKSVTRSQWATVSAICGLNHAF